MLTPRDVVTLAADPLDAAGLPLLPCAVVLLDGPVPAAEAAALASLARYQVVLGVVGADVQPDVLATLTVSFRSADGPLGRYVVGGDHERLAARVRACPRAATMLAQLLRLGLTGADGVLAESLAYSLLLGGPEFASWRARVPRRPVPDDGRVVVTRDDAVVRVVLDRPARHNAFSRRLRDGLVAAMALGLDPSVTRVVLSGAGASFCSGGDLDEFGSATDLGAAHLIRLARSAGLAVERVAGKVEARLHGACIGAGIEIPAFAGRVVADAGTTIRLPELAMGLVPGAGGTVSVTRRIGRWRTAWLALSGQDLDAATALDWGLVDEVVAG